MNNGGKLVYKCRMCGNEYSNTHTPVLYLTLIAVITGNYSLIANYVGVVPLATELHHHSDKSIGVADLIGGVPDKES